MWSTFEFQDAEEESGEAAEGGEGLASANASVAYSALYTALGSTMGEQSVLLLYSLVHSCQHFRNYVFVRGWVPLVLLMLGVDDLTMP